MFRVRLRELREAANYTSQQSFATAFGVAQSTVAGWEAGAREPKYKTILDLARFFNVSIDYLLGLTDEPFFSGSSLAAFIKTMRGDESKEDFASRCGISVRLLNRIEEGFRKIDTGDLLHQQNSLSTQDMRQIAEGLNIDWRYIACLYAGYDPRRVKDISDDANFLSFLNTTPQIFSKDMGSDDADLQLFAEKSPTLTVKDERDDSMETKLVELYHELNEEGQDKLVDYADDMVRSGKYIKSDEAIVDKEA